MSIVNADGVVLARSLEPERWIGMSVLNVGNARAHIANREGVDETRGSTTIDRIAGYTRAGRVPGMCSSACRPVPRFGRAHQPGLHAGARHAVARLGAALAAWLGVRIAQPLRRLAYDAMLFARGNLAHRTAVSTATTKPACSPTR